MHDELNRTDDYARTGTSASSGKAAELLRRPRIRLGAVVALAVAAGFIVWLVVGDGDESSPTTSPITQGPAGTGSAGPRSRQPGRAQDAVGSRRSTDLLGGAPGGLPVRGDANE